MTHSQPADAGDQTMDQTDPADPPNPPPPGLNPSAPEAETLTEAASADKAGYPYRRPVPPLPIERYDLAHPAVPPALDGLTVLHITDLHVRKGRPFMPATRAAIEALRATPADLAIFTGDYMNYPGDEASTLLALREVVTACRARLGVFGTFGNHDSWELRQEARRIPGIMWLSDHGGVVHPRAGLRLIGSDEPEDLLTIVASSIPALNADDAQAPPLTLTLVHYPTELLVGADLNLPLLFAGHTHGGQFRLGRRLAPHTSCDLPRHLASGILRLRQTLCCVSRGLGNAVIEMRANCPPQIPLYVLRHAPLPRISSQAHERITVHTAW